MRDAYVQTVGAERSTIGSAESGFNGFSQPYYIDHNDYGRGIYANADIPKSSLVWQNFRSARFDDGSSYRSFLMKLPPNLACDVMQWAYVTDDEINVDLDEGSFCNDGGREESNIDFDKEVSRKFPNRADIRIRVDMQLFATRDIAKGEELLCNYGSFSDANWEQFGL